MTQIPQLLNDRYALAAEPPRSGGMAEIYRAVDLKDGLKPVAIKLFTNSDADAYHLEAYNREYRSLQSLTHPHIVRLLDGGVELSSRRRFFVLEWLDVPLMRHLESAPLEGWDTFYDEIGRPILDALCYAYGQGILHRDLKPQNVLLSADRIIKLADFGIAKIRSILAPGITLARHHSVPYAPPEAPTGSDSETRDVHGFAALTLACLSGKLFDNYEELREALREFDGPPEISRILEAALSQDPSSRPTNVIKLQGEIESVQALRNARFAAFQQRRKCYIKLSSRVVELLRKNFSLPGTDPIQFVVKDLNEICGIKSNITPSNNLLPQDNVSLTLYTAQNIYSAIIDRDTRAALFIHHVSPAQPSVLENRREDSFMPAVSFAPQRGSMPPADGEETISWLLDGLTAREAAVREQRRIAHSERVFRTWMSILHAKNEVDRQRETPIKYVDYEKNANRLILHVKTPPHEELVTQSRLIELPEQRVVVGEVEAVTRDRIILWVREEIPDNIPRRGELLLDTRASRHAINRQRQAVDAVRFRRAARPELCDLLLDPSAARSPSDPGSIDFVLPDLDESKRRAVAKALGMDSFLVVEGPPGTGKTQFITEVVIQTLRRNPQARILLTSQTHVALDNALEQIRKFAGELRLVRIGRRGSEKVSPEITDLLLENRVEAWLKSVRARSESFLKSKSEELRVDRNAMRLGMALAALRTALDETFRIEKRIAEVSEQIEQLTAQERERAAKDSSDTYHEIKEALRESLESEQNLLSELRLAQLRAKTARTELERLSNTGAELAVLPLDELREWEAAYLEENENTRTMHRLMTLAEEWYLRCGRTREFFAALVSDSQVVAGTCIGFASVKGTHEHEFDLCIVDEASKATVTELLVPMSRASRWILVGDRKQLPPFVEDALEHPKILKTFELSKEDLRLTLLELLADRLPTACVARLSQQHRMIRQIGDLVSHCFYEGSLQSVRQGDAGLLAPALPKPVTWFDTSSLDDRFERREHRSFKNLAEVAFIIRLLKQINFIAQARRIRYDVAVLSAYGAQRLEISSALDGILRDLGSLELECNTVDAFQGREAHIAIYSVTRCNDQREFGFLSEQRRLNVALSRAKLGLAIIGDAAFVRSARDDGSNPWVQVLNYIETHPNDCAFTKVQR